MYGGEIIIKYLGKSDIVFDHNIQQDIEEFTSRSGREKGWTDLSIDEQIKIVGQKYGDWVLTNLHMARFGIYRHSSEILHDGGNEAVTKISNLLALFFIHFCIIPSLSKLVCITSIT